MEGVTLPDPPQGYEYRLMKKRPRQTVNLNERDPSELTPRQRVTLKYNEKNREKINEKSLKRYHEKKK